MSGPDYSPFFAVMGASSAMVFSGNYLSFVTVYIRVVVCVCCYVRHIRPGVMNNQPLRLP